MKLIYRIKPPCPKCPYRLGQVTFFVNPCIECKASGYRIFEQFKTLLNRAAERGEAG